MARARTRKRADDPKESELRCFNADKVRRLRATLSERDELELFARRYKALGHPVRLAILELLAREECCVCDLTNILEQPVSTLSQHLKTLKTAGLLRSRQSGRFVFYSLREPEMVRTAGFLDRSVSIGEEAR